MAFQDYLNDPSSAYNGQDSSGMTQIRGGSPGFPGVPYRQDAQDAQPYGAPQQQQTASVPGTSPTSNGGNYNQSMGLPAQQNFDAIQSAIQRQQSPYVSMPASGFLQNRFPRAAGMLDNAFLAAANTPQGHTIGENISAVAQGVIGGRQASYQHNVQQALLPVEMAQRQFAYQKQMLDVQKDQAQINMDNNNAYRYRGVGDNAYDQIAHRGQGTSGFHVDKDGQAWTMGQGGKLVKANFGGSGDIDENTGGLPDQPTFNVPGTTGRAPTLASLAVDSVGPNATPQQKLNAVVNAQSQAAGGKTGAVNNANTPQDLLKSESKAALDAIGAAPKNTHDEFLGYRASQVKAHVPYDQMMGEDAWAKANTQDYNAKKSAAQKDISDYTNAKAHQKGLTMDQFKAQRAQTQQTPGAVGQTPQRPPNVPSNYVYTEKGPKGQAGWMRPQS